uniref:Uncharacterized protein n=1 Tax=Anguilla anguilla TaxID=7936 RepID=A0A0E9R4J6_ANGAN
MEDRREDINHLDLDSSYIFYGKKHK